MNMIEFKKKWLEDLDSIPRGNHTNFCKALFDCAKPEMQSRFFFNGESFYGDDQFSNPTYLDYNPVIEDDVEFGSINWLMVLAILGGMIMSIILVGLMVNFITARCRRPYSY